jgi:hypothetical protein
MKMSAFLWKHWRFIKILALYQYVGALMECLRTTEYRPAIEMLASF